MLAKGILRFVFVGLVSVAVVVSYVLVFVGCISTSPGLPGLYVVKLANNHTQAEVHVGLFSLCAGVDTTASTTNMTCAATVGSVVSDANTTDGTVSTTTKYFLPGTTTVAASSLQPLLAMADSIQSSSTGPGGVLSLIYVPLILSALCFAAAGSSLLVYMTISRTAAIKGEDDERSFRMERKAYRSAVYLSSAAVVGAAGAAMATTVAVRALLFAGTDLPGTTVSTAASSSSSSSAAATAFDVNGGTAIQVFEWLIVVFLLLGHPILHPLWRRVM